MTTTTQRLRQWSKITTMQVWKWIFVFEYFRDLERRQRRDCARGPRSQLCRSVKRFLYLNILEIFFLLSCLVSIVYVINWCLGLCWQNLHSIKCNNRVYLQPSSNCCRRNSPHSDVCTVTVTFLMT
jgi:hypothetical protein